MKRPPTDEALGRVRQARHDPTPAERRLWQRLRNRQLQGMKFRRQVWLGPFIADFYCPDARLVVEVDGDSHAARQAYDERRTAWLATQGMQVVRVTNADVMSNIDGVLAYLAALSPSPSHSAAPSGPLPLP
ncbi:endonuclease domain-containing protein [Sphingomonas mesophila]|uniref:endonuclease domain-containing protein n=1 Tax=Sphingomonas mesophila TaxID=2303576 RepID=UPI000E5751E1|nr:endonuclease domain-containing protein [Sphingomonas mesophila]